MAFWDSRPRPPFHYEFNVQAHGNYTIETMYTNDQHHINTWIDKFEKMLQNDREKIMGIDVEYTRGPYEEQKATVIQLCFQRHCLLYQVCRSDGVNYRVWEFHRNNNYTSAGFSIEGDIQMLRRWNITVRNFVDIQTKWRVYYMTKPLDSLADVAVIIVDEYYGKMKKGFKPVQHRFWGNAPSSRLHVDYAARDVYTAYQIWTRMVNFNMGQLRHEADIARRERLREEREAK